MKNEKDAKQEPGTASGDNKENKMKGVWSIIEDEHRDRPIWVRLGTAFINKDSSINVYLDAYPMHGKLHIRDIEPRHAATEQA